MISSYLNAAMRRGKYEILKDDNTYYGEIPDCPGVYANAVTLEECREELLEVLEELIIFRLHKNLPLPTIEGIELEIKSAV